MQPGAARCGAGPFRAGGGAASGRPPRRPWHAHLPSHHPFWARRCPPPSWQAAARPWRYAMHACGGAAAAVGPAGPELVACAGHCLARGLERLMAGVVTGFEAPQSSRGRKSDLEAQIQGSGVVAQLIDNNGLMRPHLNSYNLNYARNSSWLHLPPPPRPIRRQPSTMRRRKPGATHPRACTDVHALLPLRRSRLGARRRPAVRCPASQRQPLTAVPTTPLPPRRRRRRRRPGRGAAAGRWGRLRRRRGGTAAAAAAPTGRAPGYRPPAL
jgi:hypothetical protein